jgi:hypothetical protein
MVCPAFGKHGGDPQRAQFLPRGRRIITPVPLDTMRPTSGAPPRAPHGRDGLQQGQPRCHIVPMRPCHPRRQWHPLGVREPMMRTAALPALRGMGTGCVPHRRPPADSDDPRSRGTKRAGPRRRAWLGAWPGAVARPRCGAKRVSTASRASRSRSPAPGGASPRACRTSGQRAYPLPWPDSVLAVCPPAVWAAQGVTAVQAAPTGRWVQVGLPCTQDTFK